MTYYNIVYTSYSINIFMHWIYLIENVRPDILKNQQEKITCMNFKDSQDLDLKLIWNA